MVDIHNYKIKLERTLAKIKISEISEQNKKDIFDFHNSCFSVALVKGSDLQRYRDMSLI